MKTLYICGAGNPETVRLALRIKREQARWDRILILDDDPAKHGQPILGVPVIGPFAILEHVRPDSAEITNSVTRTTSRRWAARRQLEVYGLPFATLVHPGVDTMDVEIGGDVVVYPHAHLGPQVVLGEGSVVFMGAVVGHESHLARGCIVAANAVVNGRVLLGEAAYVGTNAAILPDVKIGPWATIGAGSVVTQDVPAGATILGVPGKMIYVLSPEQLQMRMSDLDPTQPPLKLESPFPLAGSS